MHKTIRKTPENHTAIKMKRKKNKHKQKNRCDVTVRDVSQKPNRKQRSPSKQ